MHDALNDSDKPHVAEKPLAADNLIVYCLPTGIPQQLQCLITGKA